MKLRKVIEKGNPDNKKIAYDFFVNEKGYSPKIALGIIGNLMQESRTTLDTTALGFDGTGSFGVAQWLGPRKKKLKEVRPDDWNTLTGQLEFIDWELNNTEKRAASKLKEVNSVEDAALVFSKYYERPHKDFAHNDKRIRYAKTLGEELGVSFDEKVEEVVENAMPPINNNSDVPTEKTRLPALATEPINPTYTMLPQDKAPEENKEQTSPGLDEQKLRQILQAEREKTEQRFLEAFKSQNQPQEEYAPQQVQDTSHLYDYINIEKYADGGKHTVKSGDSLSKIAKQNNLTLSEIIELNSAYKDNPDLLKIGDTVNLSSTPTQSGIAGAGKFASPSNLRENNNSISPQYLSKLKERASRKQGPRQVVAESTMTRSPIINKDIKIKEQAKEKGEMSTPDEVKRMQKILFYSGYFPGTDKNKAIDGKMGPKTKAALEKYNARLAEKAKPKNKNIIDKISNTAPLSVRQYVYDTFGGEGEVNESDLSGTDFNALKEVVLKNIDRDKFKVDYDDWREARGTDKDTRDDDMNLLDPYSNLQKTLGQASIKIDDAGDIYVKDKYNFNDAGKKENRYKNAYTTDDGLLPVSADNSVSNNIYRIARNFKTKNGSKDGGSPVKIYIGNVSDIF